MSELIGVLLGAAMNAYVVTLLLKLHRTVLNPASSYHREFQTERPKSTRFMKIAVPILGAGFSLATLGCLLKAAKIIFGT